MDRVIDTRWDPPVTVGVRLVSVVNDCTQHVGQAAYVRGLIENRRWLPYLVGLNRFTPTHWMKRLRCPQNMRRELPCGRSRFLLMRPVSRTPLIHWPVLTSSSV